MTTEAPAISISPAALPPLGAPLEGGTFAGLITQPDGTHVAVVLLPARGKGLPWKKAVEWAAEQGGQLPTRPIAALIFANVKDRPQSGWHWTSEEHAEDDSYAWHCDFHDGDQCGSRKSYEGCAVAVRCIPLGA